MRSSSDSRPAAPFPVWALHSGGGLGKLRAGRRRQLVHAWQSRKGRWATCRQCGGRKKAGPLWHRRPACAETGPLGPCLGCHQSRRSGRSRSSERRSSATSSMKVCAIVFAARAVHEPAAPHLSARRSPAQDAQEVEPADASAIVRMGERLPRELPRQAPRRTPQRRDLLRSGRGEDRHRALAPPLQHQAPARIASVSATGSRGRLVAGCAIRSRFAGHARRSARTCHAPGLKPENRMGAGHGREAAKCRIFRAHHLLHTQVLIQVIAASPLSPHVFGETP